MASRQPVMSRTDSQDTSHSSTQSTHSFDSHSISMGPSEPTSDERPDLGASFTTVIRELAYLMQPPLRDVVMRHNSNMRSFTPDDRDDEGLTAQDDYTFTPSDLERGRDSRTIGGNDSTVWDNRRIASYLASHTPSFTPSHTEPGEVHGSSYPHAHSTPRTLLQTALNTRRSSPIRESSFTPDIYPSDSVPHQVYHRDYHPSIINDWESKPGYLTISGPSMPYVESRSQSQNPSTRTDGELDEERAVEIHDTLSSIRSSSLPSFTPDPEAPLSPAPPSQTSSSIRLRIDHVSTTPDAPPSASEVPLSAFNHLSNAIPHPTRVNPHPVIPLSSRSPSSDIVNDVSEDPRSSRLPSFSLQSQNVFTPSAPSSSSRPQSASSKLTRDDSPQRSAGAQGDYETVHIDSSIDSSVISHTEDEESDAYVRPEERGHFRRFGRLVLDSGLDLVREESTEGGVRHEVIRPLVLREDSSTSDLVLPLNYPGHSRFPSGNSGVSSSESTLSSRNNTLSGSHTISAKGTIHYPSPRRAYSPPGPYATQNPGTNPGGHLHMYHDEYQHPNDAYTISNLGDTSASSAHDPTISSFDPMTLYRRGHTNGPDDNEEPPPPSASQSELDDVSYDDRGNEHDPAHGYTLAHPTNVYFGGRDSSMARSLPNLGRVALDDDESDDGYDQPPSGLSFDAEFTSVQPSPNTNPSLGTLAEALTYLAQEREKIARGRNGVDEGGTLPLNIKGKSKETVNGLDTQYDEPSAHEQDFRGGGKATSHTNDSGGLSDQKEDVREGWRDILEFRHRRRRKRSGSPHGSSKAKSKSSRASTTSTVATILPADLAADGRGLAKSTTSTGSRTPKSSNVESVKVSKRESRSDRQRLSLDIDAASPSSPLSSLNLSIRLPSFATALSPTGTFTSGGENVRDFGIFRRKGRHGKGETESKVESPTTAKGKGKTKSNAAGKAQKRSAQDEQDDSPSKGKKSERLVVPRILKRPPIPFPTFPKSVPATAQDSIQQVDNDATPVISSASFSEQVDPGPIGRKLSTHSRASTLRSASAPLDAISIHATYLASSDADDWSGLGADDADADEAPETGVDDNDDQSEGVVTNSGKQDAGDQSLDSHNWQQRLVNDHRSRLGHSRSRKSSRVRRGHTRGNSEQLAPKDYAAQADYRFPRSAEAETLDNPLRSSQGHLDRKTSKSRSSKKETQTRRSLDHGKGSRHPLIHARSSPLLRPSEHLDALNVASDQSSSGGHSARKLLPPTTPGPDPNSTPGSLSDSNCRRVAQLRALGQKLRKAFPEDIRSLNQVAVISEKGSKNHGTGNLSSRGSGRDSDNLKQPFGAQGKKKRSRRKKAGGSGNGDGGDDADDAGDEEEEEDESIWEGGFIDTRGPLPKATDPPIHVFIDHSNILIGLLNYLKRRPHLSTSSTNQANPKQSTKHLSHAALSLLLERGRPVTRRVMVASSPLYQPMEGAARLQYEVHIFKRVPQDDVSPTATPADPNERFGVATKKGHHRQISGNTSTESDQGLVQSSSGGVTTLSKGFIRNSGADGLFTKPGLFTNNSAPIALGSSPSSYAGNQPVIPAPPQKIRYREQGVDELLQLKLHQVLLRSHEVPVAGSTIVLATGDGNAGQFNEEGFVEPVRIALERGWKVELYAWEDGLSRTWRREFGEGDTGKGPSGKKGGKKKLEEDTIGSGAGAKDYGGRFRIIAMEQFGAELVEVDGWNLGLRAPSVMTE